MGPATSQAMMSSWGGQSINRSALAGARKLRSLVRADIFDPIAKSEHVSFLLGGNDGSLHVSVGSQE